MAEELGDVEAFGNAGDDFLWGVRTGLQEVVAGANSGCAGEAARGVGRGFHLELAGGVRVQEVRFQNAVFDDDRASRGNAFAVEGAGAETAHDSAVVDDGDVVARDFFAKLAREKRSAPVDGVAVDAFKDVVENRTRDERIEDDGNVRGLDLASAEPA